MEIQTCNQHSRSPVKKQNPIFAAYTISDTAGCEPLGTI